MMIVVGDTSPLTGLLQIGRDSLLVTLFGKVLVPPAVRDELLQFHVSIPPVIEIHPIHDHEAATLLGNDLGVGESEAIVLAQESQADYLLMDDNRARHAAELRGLRVIGLLGVLVIAKKAGLIDAVAPLIDELEVKSRFFVSDAVRRIILSAVGESPTS